MEVKSRYEQVRAREVRLDWNRKKSAEFGSFRNRACPTFSDRTRLTRAQYIWKLLNSNFLKTIEWNEKTLFHVYLSYFSSQNNLLSFITLILRIFKLEFLEKMLSLSFHALLPVTPIILRDILARFLWKQLENGALRLTLPITFRPWANHFRAIQQL